MATSDSALLQEMDNYTLDGKYHEATDDDVPEGAVLAPGGGEDPA